MKTSDQTSTFKVYKSHANNTYKNIEKDKIESAFVEFVKEKGEIGNDRYFNVKYKTVNGTDIFEFTRASTQPSPPLESTQPSNPREFGIFLNNYQCYDPNNTALFTISNANAKIIKDHQDKIRDGIILCPQGDNTITFHKDFIKAGLEDYVNEHGMPSHNLEISTVRDGKPIFKATGKKVNDGSQFIVELPNGSTLGEGPTFKELYNLTIGNATYRELQMVDLQRRKTYFELQNEKIKNSLNSQIEIIEAEIRQKDINTISSFFATPDANTESSDQTSTTENENKIKELLTRVLATDEKETESEKTFNEKLKAYFVQMAKADMEKSFKSGKQSKLYDLIKGFGNDEATKGLIYEAINEEDIKIMSSFFATPAPNNESSDQTSTTENENKIKELLTRVLTTDANESESEKEIKKRLKDHFVEIAKAEIEKSFKGGESSKLDKALQILKNSILDTNTSINFAILNGRITEIKDGVKETIRKEAEIMAKTQTTMDKARIKAEEIIREATLTKDELTIYDFFATPAVNPENATKIIELLTRVLTTHEKETESEKEIKKNLKAYFVEMAKAEMEELSEHEHSKLEELLRMPISNANVNTFIKSEIESDDVVNDLTLTKGIYIAKKAAIDNFFSVMTLEENLEEDITKITNAIAVDQKLMKHFQSKLNENSQRITLLKTLLKNFKFPDTIRDCEINIDKLASINISAKKILTSAKNIAAIDAFFKGPYKEGVPEKTKTEIETKILADPELMKYFKDKLDACENKFTTLTNSHPSQRDQESKKLITEKIRKLTTSAQEILTTAQKKIEKITQLVDNVFHSISPSGTQAPETLAEGAEEEKNVHAIEEFLSQLKSAIDKGKSRVGKTQAAKNIKNIKDAFSKSFPSDDSDPSIDFKIEFFNSLVDNLNNPDFVTKYQIKNSPTDQPQSQLSSSFSQAFNGKTIGALNALSDSIKTHEDHKLSTIIFRGKKDLYIQSENGGEIAQSKNLVYSTIFSSLFLASIKRLRSSDSASASADKAPAPEAGSPSWAQPSRASDKHSPPL